MRANYKKITTPKHIRQVLSNTINQLINGEVEPRKALAIGNLCQTMLKAIEASSLQERLEKLERIFDVEIEPIPTKSDIRRLKSVECPFMILKLALNG